MDKNFLKKAGDATGMHVNDLFRKMQSGDERALHSLFLIYFSRLNDFAARIISDPVTSEDITQEVFVSLWEHKDRLQIRNIEPFLYKVVRNKCIDYVKYLKITENRKVDIGEQLEFEELYHIDFIRDDPYILIEEELRAKIEKTIERLPARCREVFKLSRVDGLKNREVAGKLDISIKNVERHLKRALHAFQEAFPEKFPLAIIVMVLSEI